MTLWLRRCATFEDEAEADREYWQQYSPDERVAQMNDLRMDWATMSNEIPRPNRDHAEFVAALRLHKVRALIVGAHALAFHAKPRYTKDLDIFVDASPENAVRIVAALDAFGFGALGITVADFAEHRIVQLGQPPNRIDLMTSIDGISFEEAWAGRVEGMYAGEAVFYIGKPELMRNKAASRRPQDLADLDLLRRF